MVGVMEAADCMREYGNQSKWVVFVAARQRRQPDPRMAHTQGHRLYLEIYLMSRVSSEVDIASTVIRRNYHFTSSESAHHVHRSKHEAEAIGTRRLENL